MDGEKFRKRMGVLDDASKTNGYYNRGDCTFLRQRSLAEVSPIENKNEVSFHLPLIR